MNPLRGQLSWDEVLDRADAAFADSRGSGTWKRARCPFCPLITGKDDRDGALHFNKVDGWFTCHRCKMRGRLRGFDDGAPRPAPAAPPAPVDHRIPEFVPLVSQSGCSSRLFAPARAYLEKRGLGDRWLWAEAGIGACAVGKYAGRVVVPVYGEAGRWRWWVARSWVPGAKRKYLMPSGDRPGLMYNEEALAERTHRPLLVVEGVFDALPYWPDAVAVLGKPTEAQVLRLAAAPRPVAVVLDGDAWMEAEALALRLRLEGQTAGYVRLPPKRDPDEVEKAWLLGQCKKCLGADLP